MTAKTTTHVFKTDLPRPLNTLIEALEEGASLEVPGIASITAFYDGEWFTKSWTVRIEARFDIPQPLESDTDRVQQALMVFLLALRTDITEIKIIRRVPSPRRQPSTDYLRGVEDGMRAPTHEDPAY